MNDEIFFLFLNLNIIPGNSTPEGSPKSRAYLYFHATVQLIGTLRSKDRMAAKTSLKSELAFFKSRLFAALTLSNVGEPSGINRYQPTPTIS